MDELISRQAAIKRIDEALARVFTEPCGELILRNLPSAQPKQKPEKWVDDGDPLTWVCSECGYRVVRYNNTPYCPNCGADMRGEQDE